MKQKKRIILYIVIFVLIITSFYKVFRREVVDGTSMYPTFEDGEQLISYTTQHAKRGQIITFYDTSHHKDLIKRVIAVEGDVLEIRDSKVYVNGALLDEPYLSEHQFNGEIDVTIPEDCVWVMGDNRNNSRDSREFGFVKTKFIHGVVLPIFY